MRLTLLAQGFKGGDLMALNRPKRQVAGGLGPAIDQHHAGPALALTTPQLRTRQAHLISKQAEQGGGVWQAGSYVLSVDSEVHE